MALPQAVYSNLASVHPVLKGAVARKAAARSEALAEAWLRQKVDQSNRVLGALDARASLLASQLKELQRAKTAVAARIERIEDKILGYMDDAGLDHLAGVRTSMRMQPSPAALEIVDAALIPAVYWRQPKTPPKEPDKIAVKNALAASADIQPADWGCKLTQRVTLVRR
jgi:hypothetical protein